MPNTKMKKLYTGLPLFPEIQEFELRRSIDRRIACFHVSKPLYNCAGLIDEVLSSRHYFDDDEEEEVDTEVIPIAPILKMGGANVPKPKPNLVVPDMTSPLGRRPNSPVTPEVNQELSEGIADVEIPNVPTTPCERDCAVARAQMEASLREAINKTPTSPKTPEPIIYRDDRVNPRRRRNLAFSLSPINPPSPPHSGDEEEDLVASDSLIPGTIIG
jgi:hypothetical protein